MCGGRGFILTEHEDLELRSALTQLYEEYDHIEGAEFYISQGAQAVADLRAAQPSELREAAQMALDWFDKGLGQSAYAAEVMERLRAALRKG
jgi:predicted ATPase